MYYIEAAGILQPREDTKQGPGRHLQDASYLRIDAGTYGPARYDEINLGAIRAWHRAMSDEELLASGKAAAYMASRATSYVPPRRIWRIRLAEAGDTGVQP